MGWKYAIKLNTTKKYKSLSHPNLVLVRNAAPDEVLELRASVQLLGARPCQKTLPFTLPGCWALLCGVMHVRHLSYIHITILPPCAIWLRDWGAACGTVGGVDCRVMGGGVKEQTRWSQNNYYLWSAQKLFTSYKKGNVEGLGRDA